jgi:hypothetical protein
MIRIESFKSIDFFTTSPPITCVNRGEPGHLNRRLPGTGSNSGIVGNTDNEWTIE